ncbi:hypothetical protein EV368DRAFT_81105 [Lentinula lateritia]|nr:hypothetical protein EV368DRAFT_81105 [Lentinula lateritia]
MSPPPSRFTSTHASSPSLPAIASPAPESNGEVEQDQLTFTIEAPSRPQLLLFENVFNTGKLLAAYCQVPEWLQGFAGLSVLHKLFCQKDLRRFLELHGTPTHHATWGIPLGTWCQYNANLNEHTSSTTTLLELNMLDEQDAVNADHKELQRALQQEEAILAAKRRHNPSPLPVAGPSCKKTWSDAPRKRSCRKSPVMEVPSDLSPMPPPPQPNCLSSGVNWCRVLVVWFSWLPLLRAPCQTSFLPTCLLFLAQLWYPVFSFLFLTVLRISRENSSLMTALWDTSHALEARQQEVKQLRSFSREALQHEVEYCRVLDDFLVLEREIPGPPGRSLLERSQKLQEDL